MTRALLAGAVLLAASVEAGQAPARPPRDASRDAQPSGRATITGRISAADSGVPLRNALVEAANALKLSREVTTDDNGRFEFRDVEAGVWQLTASKSGYLARMFGQSRPFGRAASITVSAGQQVNVDIPLTRASAIVGRVYDEYGEPVTAARVTVMRPRMVRERRYLEPVGEGDVTDDTGAFRLHSLPAGEYFVTASARIAPPDSVVQTTFAPTFYPGTADFVSAQRVRAAPGTDSVIDFPLLPLRTARVSGRVITSGGRAADVLLNLTSDAGELGTPRGAGGVTRDDGTFAMADIPPGTYTLVAELWSGPSTVAEVGAMKVTVSGTDVEGIVITTAKPGTLRGTIVADAGVRRRLPDTVEIATRPRRPGAQGTFATATGTSFEMSAPPGQFTFDVDVPEGWMLKSVMLGGLDASDLAIDIGGEQNVPVNVVLTDRLTDVHGTVSGAGAPGASVVVFSADSGRWTARRVRSTRADARGQYRILGLPAGERYLAVAVDDLDEGQEYDPEFLSRVQRDAAMFDLGSDGRHTLDLKVLQP